jgi:translation initiation factor IF-3
VRLNGVENEPLGIVSIMEALRMAGEAGRRSGRDRRHRRPPGLPADGLRQVQVPGAEEGRRGQSKQKVIEIKEVKFRPGTDDGDYNIKMRNLRRFIAEDGDKGKVTLRFRGREITHQDIGMRMLERIRDELADVAHGRAHAQAGRPPDDHGAGAEEEAVTGCLGGNEASFRGRRSGHRGGFEARSRCRPTSTTEARGRLQQAT